MSIINNIKKEINEKGAISISDKINILSKNEVINFTEPMDDKGTSLGKFIIYNMFSDPHITKIMGKKEIERFKKRIEHFTDNQKNYYINEIINKRLKKLEIDPHSEKKIDKAIDLFFLIQSKQQDSFLKILRGTLDSYDLMYEKDIYANILENSGFTFDLENPKDFLEEAKNILDSTENRFHSFGRNSFSCLYKDIIKHMKISLYKPINHEKELYFDMKDNIFHVFCLDNSPLPLIDKYFLERENKIGLNPVDYSLLFNNDKVIKQIVKEKEDYSSFFKGFFFKNDINKVIVNSKNKVIKSIDTDKRKIITNSLASSISKGDFYEITRKIENEKYSIFEKEPHKLLLSLYFAYEKDNKKEKTKYIERIKIIWNDILNKFPEILKEQNEAGQTLAHQVILKDKKENSKTDVIEAVFDILIKHNIDINIKDNNGNPAFFHFISRHSNIMDKMIENNMLDISIKNNKKENMLDFSSLSSKTSFYKKILTYMEKTEIDNQLTSEKTQKRSSPTL